MTSISVAAPAGGERGAGAGRILHFATDLDGVADAPYHDVGGRPLGVVGRGNRSRSVLIIQRTTVPCPTSCPAARPPGTV